MNATPKCQKCRKADAFALCQVENIHEIRDMSLCEECMELASCYSCDVDIITTYGTPEDAADVLDPK